ncbi:helix-turn-helix transcriptional regulator [Nocardiopsis sp. CT-R113]|uniref:Helix-turn-helix transcriptional regulator n=1 Tax=Nocardiopsis codii TaxID=3065942 RepID=A0ABU7K0S4_9ACTN|nr:helix-turn-helix transcriptional regulator [Nocardiopsis sp. CT-R113]MEE2035769.1 helix-turn-helix transcriptional regulator [Nocardiopsis sp. CT-R113]
MPPSSPQLSPGQRVAWHRLRRGLSQEVLAGLVGRTADWLGKVENDRAPLDRLSVISSLADALSVSVVDLIGDHAHHGHHNETDVHVAEIRSVLMDYRQISSVFPFAENNGERPDLRFLRNETETVMGAYQASDYSRVFRGLPDLLARAQTAVRVYEGGQRRRAGALLALACQACAMILTKVGESDLAWIATERGMKAAFDYGDLTLQGSLMRSGVHSLHSRGQHETAVALTREAASYLRQEQGGRPTNARLLSVYGTLLLPGAVAAARNGDRSSAVGYLDEAERVASQLGRDANHLWTAFGPTNVVLHRVTVAASLGDPRAVLELGIGIDTAALPRERRVRHLFDVAGAFANINEIPSAVERMLEAERLAASHVHRHVMSHQIVGRMMRTKAARRDRRLADLAHRMGMF